MQKLRQLALEGIHYFRQLSLTRQLLLIVAAAGTLAVMGFIGLVVLVSRGFFGPLPKDTELMNISHPVATEIYSADTVLLGKFQIQERSAIPFDQISPAAIEALIATEDIRFYKHDGVDYRSLARVLVKTLLLQKESSGGGSTITQQLVKNLYPRKQYTAFSIAINKIKEALTARRVEELYTKDEILVLYLNTIPFGDNTFGIEAAAERFYSTSASELTYDQAAVLIGMLKAT